MILFIKYLFRHKRLVKSEFIGDSPLIQFNLIERLTGSGDIIGCQIICFGYCYAMFAE